MAPASSFVRGKCAGQGNVKDIFPLPHFLVKYLTFPFLFQFADLVAPDSSLPWLCEDNTHWFYFLTNHSYLSVPDPNGEQNI